MRRTNRFAARAFNRQRRYFAGESRLDVNEHAMGLKDLWQDLVLKFKKKFLGYVEPPPKWASSVARSAPSRESGSISRQGKVSKGDVSDWLAKTNKEVIRTYDDNEIKSAGLTPGDRAAIFGLIDVVEKLSEDLRIVSYKVDVIYKNDGIASAAAAPRHPFGTMETTSSGNDAEKCDDGDQDDIFDQMKQTERAWFKVGPNARYSAQKTLKQQDELHNASAQGSRLNSSIVQMLSGTLDEFDEGLEYTPRMTEFA